MKIKHETFNTHYEAENYMAGENINDEKINGKIIWNDVWFCWVAWWYEK